VDAKATSNCFFFVDIIARDDLFVVVVVVVVAMNREPNELLPLRMSSTKKRNDGNDNGESETERVARRRSGGGGGGGSRRRRGSGSVLVTVSAAAAVVLVGTRLEVYWPQDDRYYAGTVSATRKTRTTRPGGGGNNNNNKNKNKRRKLDLLDGGTGGRIRPKADNKEEEEEVRVEYDDGEVEWLDLSSERYNVLLRGGDDDDGTEEIDGAERETSDDDDDDGGARSASSERCVRVGTRISVWWEAYGAYFDGAVTRIEFEKRRRRAYYFVEYDDGDAEWILLGERKYEVLLAAAEEEYDDDDDDEAGCEVRRENDRKPSSGRVSSSSSKKKKRAEIAEAAADAVVVGGVDVIEVGTRIAVWWELYAKYFEGTVMQIHDKKQKSRLRYYIVYDDGDEEWVCLKKNKYKLIQEETTNAAAAAAATSTAATVDVGMRIAVWWDAEDMHYECTVRQIADKEKSMPLYYIVYDDGDKEWICLKKHKYKLIPEENRNKVVELLDKPVGNDWTTSHRANSTANKKPAARAASAKVRRKEATPRGGVRSPPAVGNVAVGSRVAVAWFVESKKKRFYHGIVRKIRHRLVGGRRLATARRLKEFYIEYDDGDEKWEDLSQRTFKLMLFEKKNGQIGVSTEEETVGGSKITEEGKLSGPSESNSAAIKTPAARTPRLPMRKRKLPRNVTPLSMAAIALFFVCCCAHRSASFTLPPISPSLVRITAAAKHATPTVRHSNLLSLQRQLLLRGSNKDDNNSAKPVSNNVTPLEDKIDPGIVRRTFPKLPWHRLPNWLTYMRCVCIPVLIGMFYVPNRHVACASLFAVASITDWLDGYLARRWNVTSSFGAFLDPVADVRA